MKRRIYTMAEMAEDAGHMGYSSRDYPGCPERIRKEQQQMDLIEAAFDEANRENEERSFLRRR